MTLKEKKDKTDSLFKKIYKIHNDINLRSDPSNQVMGDTLENEKGKLIFAFTKLHLRESLLEFSYENKDNDCIKLLGTEKYHKMLDKIVKDNQNTINIDNVNELLESHILTLS